ncbi:protein-glutamate O-methyltransferase CheR [Bacteriovorax stolpii]|uniref:CheR family methyltransferase n=1 Tax=Bacteriovorax stolpii TaxID=960 RepID=UPI0011595558|nr:protein-glutamate O-methyltransferase CheR [Bacteriovorax stolpii]QDK42598.1 protein-glutamate O-methyltransferase CheR [Bacteriovorax stolpii]
MITDSLWTAFGPSPLTQEDFEYFAGRIKKLSGISMKQAKLDLIKTRLTQRLREHSYKNFSDYRNYLETLPDTHEEWQEFINILTTNKTDFFREPDHFHFLIQYILPKWLKEDKTTFHIWSAAASTGEEAYTLAMILKHYLPPGRDFKIIGTDIDTKVLKTAENAVYSLSKLHEIPDLYRDECLDIGEREAKGWFRIKAHLKEKVTFVPHNLIEASFVDDKGAPKIFDLILCRNVLIYFDKKTTELIAHKLYEHTIDQGFLFIGHSESFQGCTHSWLNHNSSIYQKAKRA